MRHRSEGYSHGACTSSGDAVLDACPPQARDPTTPRRRRSGPAAAPPTATPETYARCLCRIWGFEASVEAALARTYGLGELVDLRGRTHIRRLRADLAALGVTSPSALPSFRTVPVLQIADALGWMYVVEHNAQVYGERALRRQLDKRIPHQLASAGSYLFGGPLIATRMNELGAAFDELADKPEQATRIGDAARLACSRQKQWFAPATARAAGAAAAARW